MYSKAEAKIVKEKKKKRMSQNDVIFHIITITIFTLIAFVCIYPFYYMLITSVSNNQLVALGKISFLPRGIHFENYIRIFKQNNIARSALISVARTIVGTCGSLIVTSYMAYFFTKQEMWGRKAFYRYTVITMYFSAGMIAEYLNNTMLGLTNTFWIYIIPGLLNVYNMILIKTSIESMPYELEESAMLDGAGYLKIFTKIILPLNKPILATVGLFSAVSHWNDFFTTKLYVTNPKLYTLQFQLYELLNQVRALADASAGDQYSLQAVTPAGIRMALTAVVVIPVMCVYPFIQKYYVKGIMIGAVKG